MGRYLKVFFSLAVLGTVLYLINIRGGYVFDDFKTLFMNPFISGFGFIPQLWEFDPTRFLPNLTFSINLVSNLGVVGFHLVNLLLHISCAFFVYLLSDLLISSKWPELNKASAPWFISPAMVVALIFLTHPLQTSAVSYICQRSTVMLTLFYLGSVYFYLRAREERHFLFYGGALLLSILGAFTKPIIISLPLMICFVEFLFRDDRSDKLPRRLAAVAPFFLLWVLLPQLGILLKHSLANPFSIIDLTRQTNAISRADYFFTQFSVLMKYIQLLFVPLGQNLDYDFPIFKSLFELPSLFSFTALIFLIYFVVKWLPRQPWLAFAMIWFLVTLVPESSLYPLEDVLFEHRLYLPMVGFAIFLTAWIFRIKRPQRRMWVIGILVTILSALTISRNYIWADAERLLKDTVAKSPLKLRPRYNLASLYIGQGQMNAAEDQLREALRVDPKEPVNYYNLGRIYEGRQDIEQAIKYFSVGAQTDRAAVAADCFWRLGYLSVAKKDFKNAELYYHASLEINPQFENARCDLANLYMTTDRLKMAIPEYQKAIQINPRSFNGLNGLAAAYVMSGETKRGLQEYLKLVKLYPDSRMALVNLGKVYVLSGDLINAEPVFKKALALDSQNPEIPYYLGMIYTNLGDPQEGQRYQQIANELKKSQSRNVDKTITYLPVSKSGAKPSPAPASVQNILPATTAPQPPAVKSPERRDPSPIKL